MARRSSPPTLNARFVPRPSQRMPCERERASRLAPSRLVGGCGSGGQIPAWSLRCVLAPDDEGVAAGVDIADGDDPAVGLRISLSLICGEIPAEFTTAL